MVGARILTVSLVALAASASVLIASAGAASHPQLVGVVGKNDAYTISLDKGGKVAKTLKAGTYTFVIHDDSKMHNYELDGPNGKSWSFTSVPFVGTKTKTIKLAPGKYKAYCEAHESVMFQHFSVR
jgi:hypothetical protein